MADRYKKFIRSVVKDILLTTINAKWIHPSLALRLLKANLGALEDRCEIIEFAHRQPLNEKLEPLLAARPKILGISVSIWNHSATLELLANLANEWAAQTDKRRKPVMVLGGPEVSHLPRGAVIFRYADYVISGEGEEAFRSLCEKIIACEKQTPEYHTEIRNREKDTVFITAPEVDLSVIKNAYYLYTDEDIAKKLIYVEASRGCPFNCEFCLSAVKSSRASTVREYPLEQFFSQMDTLVNRGVRTFKFLDRTFNLNIPRALKIITFFLEKIEESKEPFMVHFEMVPSLFPPELLDALTLFPPDTLRLEIGVQTLNADVSLRIGRPACGEPELNTIRFLREKTNAIIHLDLIAGLPGEDLESFGEGFDHLWLALSETGFTHTNIEIQPGILKLLPGAPIARHNADFNMRYNTEPPYEVLETSCMTTKDIARIKNFARFWELLVNRDLIGLTLDSPVFRRFLDLSDYLKIHFGRNYGIDKYELLEIALNYLSKSGN
ncbi:MAG: B12-binding domain-containing radical SAM protein [Treponema sp.]|jgi:radical SAM superfamily enzyme YgiQ (UPF0313 family)|nr:B12-binding domain-containing radical SAM protein [Treponema sp.]